MTQQERRLFLINYLLNENESNVKGKIPEDEIGQKRILRGLFNVRHPAAISEEFIRIQDQYLQNEILNKGIVDYKCLTPIQNGIYLWQGDITLLKCDGIVNAANSALLGCFSPNHSCIDNAIHTYAGVQLRFECNEIMEKQNCNEETGCAKITSSYNLPCNNIIHTVGPIVSRGVLTDEHKEQLTSCYKSCLNIALDNNLKSIGFCCISTGVFGFPQQEAAEIAINVAKEFKNKIEIIFNVFKEGDFEIYRKLLTKR